VNAGNLFRILVSVAAVVGGAITASAADYVWVEGEKPEATNFPAKSWFDASTFPETAHLLSGGQWLSASGKRGKDELFARYVLDVPADGQWTLWTRKFWQHGPFRWRFDQAAWQTCGRDCALADSTFLRQHLGANWVNLGQVQLAKGRHTLELRLLADEGEETTACFDAFLLTRQPFMPRGKLKPDERSGQADEGYFAWEPAVDSFTGEALLDLRYLNEKTAGQSGFLGRKGDGFVLGDGKPVRFWAVNVGPNNIGQDHATIDYLARKLAKLGVNMVRCHGAVFDESAADPAAVDKKRLDDVCYLVAALKREGIYTTLSFYFPVWFNAKPSYGLGDYEKQESKVPFALLYFDPRMQHIHRAWAKALLTTKNPYTGLALGRDPAVGAVEIINEDSYFFWTFTARNLPAEKWAALERLFGQWLTAKYGSLDKALAAWGSAKHENDRPAEGGVGLFDAWHMTGDGSRQGGPDKTRRMGDQVQFLAESQRRFYADTAKFLKEECKLGGLVLCSNWITADANMLDAIERWTYTAGDVIDRHGYFDGKHEGDGASYSVRVGHAFAPRAAVTSPDDLPLQVNQVVGYPHIVSEIGWPNPNPYRADMTFLMSAYGSLQGVDGFYSFAVGSDLLADTGMEKFAVSCPVIAGTFPAAALQYRRGDVAEAPAVFHQDLALADLFAMKGSSGAAAQALDAFRQQDVPGGQSKGRRGAATATAFDPLTFYVGRVDRAFADKSRTVVDPRVAQLIDREKGVVRSVTGELAIDYRRGLAKVVTPRSCGAAGFLAKAGTVELGGVTVTSKNEFGQVWLIALDDKPLKESRRILLQAVTEERPYGFRVEGERITALGGWPLGIRRIDTAVTLAFPGADQFKAVALDENGYARRDPVATEAQGGRLRVQLRPDAVHCALTR
jgi:hypothetical protein